MKTKTTIGIMLGALFIFLLGFFGGIYYSHAPTTPNKQSSSQSKLQALHVNQTSIVNEKNHTIIIHGINRSGTEYACIQGWGIFDGPSDQHSIDAIRTWHINAVRIPLNEDCWLGINGVKNAYAGIQYQSAIKQYVALLIKNHLIPILELHWSAPGTEKATGQQQMPDQDHSIEFWKEVAIEFKDNGTAIFEPYNEPHPNNNLDTPAAWSCWENGGTCPALSYKAAGMQKLVDTIRATGATNIIALAGIQYGNSLSQWNSYKPKDPLNNLIATWHVYDFNLCNTLSCYAKTVKPVLQHVPVVATEIGESDTQGHFIEQLMDWLDTYHQGYVAWTWDTWDSPMALIGEYNGTVHNAYGQTYKNHLKVF